MKARKRIKHLVFSRLDDAIEGELGRELYKALWGQLYVTKWDIRWHIFIGMSLHEEA